MRVYCLSGHPNRPCLLVRFKTSTLMLDTGLEMSSLVHFLPLSVVPIKKFLKLPSFVSKDERIFSSDASKCIKELNTRYFIDSPPEVSRPEISMMDLSEVDAILISNYHHMLALPYITEYTDFKGEIYMTEPTFTMGRLFMEEMIHWIERCPKELISTQWKEPHMSKLLPQPMREALGGNLSSWAQLYSKHEMESSLAKVKLIGYSEKRDIFGALTVMPTSSGFCLGSCNWVLTSSHEKLVYLSSSSTLTTHPRPMDQNALRDSDALVLSGLTQSPTHNPDAMIGEFCVNTAITLRNGGSVLVPCFPSGVTYDLFECLSSHLESSHLGSVPLYFISPVAKQSLGFSNIFAEWLSHGKQSKVYLPDYPFVHGDLIRQERLRHFHDIYDPEFSKHFKTPCVVFTGHPSLRFGDAVHFLQLWGKDNRNTIIFTEPDFPYHDALAPFQPLAMKAYFTPIDTSLSFAQANKLIPDLRPKRIVIADQYTRPPLYPPHRTDLCINNDFAPLAYRRGEVVKVNVEKTYENIELHPDLATSLSPSEVKAGVLASTLTAQMVVRDNKMTLHPSDHLTLGLWDTERVVPPAVTGSRKRKILSQIKEEEKKEKSEIQLRKPPSKQVYGNLDLATFVGLLRQQGFENPKVEESGGGGAIVEIDADTLITIEEGSTHIICEGQETMREKLRDILLECLPKI